MAATWQRAYWTRVGQSVMYYSVPEDEKKAEQAILGRYFAALEDGTAAQFQPDPSYQWRFYPKDVDLARLRANLERLDVYLNAEQQHNWAQSNHGNKREVTFDRGPDLSRLPDAAVLALYQQLDFLHSCFPGRQS